MEFKKIQTVAFFVVLIGVGLLFYKMISPYLLAIFWAAVIATMAFPTYNALQKKIKNDNASAAATVVLVLIVVIIPLASVLGLVVKQAVATYTLVNSPTTLTRLQSTAQNVVDRPLIKNIAGEIDVKIRLRESAQLFTSTAVQWVRVGSQNTLGAIVQIFIMLFALFYFLKDGVAWLEKLTHLLPFGDANELRLYNKFTSVSKATLKGTLLLGVLQGTAGGLLFFVVGIPSAAFWGLIMIVLSIIPAVGAFLVWAPASVYLLAVDDYGQAIMLIVGGIGIGLIDNLLRGPLVGKDVQMHPLIIFFSTIGGLALFGVSGVAIGPMVAAFFATLIAMYEERYKKELDSATT